MDWKTYEKEIFTYFKEQYPDAEITLDIKVIGLYSKVKRQIDILIEQYIAGNRIIIAIDGKYFNKKVDVKAVESYIGMLEDIGAHKGLLISKEGFTEAAYNRAHFGPTEIELDILNFNNIELYQGQVAIPYAGDNGAIVSAPFGWIIDNQKSDNWIATMYQQGSNIHKAMKLSEFMYIQFWDRNEDGDTLDDLLKLQESNFKKADLNAKIEYLPTIKRNDAQVMLRAVTISSYPTPEYTGFIEFESSILFCVMFSPENRSRQNIRKLENVLESALPIKVQHQKS
ncbi:hypothetical protein SPONN_1297 [uncultured Candidatus Thioglobus sp.]|nr:hypothetical protein SPONN_1297 [uncultured Candidatus Thioglobus sp.]